MFKNMQILRKFCPPKWLYSNQMVLHGIETLNILNSIDTFSQFTILDIRDPYEINISDLPQYMNGQKIPKINIEFDDLLQMNDDELFNMIDLKKYVIVLDYQGKFQGKVAFRLNNRGYKVLQTHGGISGLSNFIDKIKPYNYKE